MFFVCILCVCAICCGKCQCCKNEAEEVRTKRKPMSSLTEQEKEILERARQRAKLRRVRVEEERLRRGSRVERGGRGRRGGV